MLAKIVSQCFPASSTRNSRVEALRIGAILMICGMHVLGSYFQTTNPANREFIVLWNAVGNAGVSVFVLISGFYGIRFRLERLVQFWLLIWTFSMLLLLCQAALGTESITAQTLRNAVFPIASRRWWFVTAYFLLFCLSPALNVAAERLGKVRYGKLVALLMLFLVVAPTLTFADPTGDKGKGTLYVVFLYMAGRYYGLYGFPRLVREHAWLLLIGSAVLIFVGNSLISLRNHSVALDLCLDTNLLIFIEASCIVYLAQRGTCVVRWVNALAGFVFPLYLFHGLLLPYWNMEADSAALPLYVLGKLLMLLAVCVVVEVLRRLLLGGITARLGEHIVSGYRQVEKRIHDYSRFSS